MIDRKSFVRSLVAIPAAFAGSVVGAEGSTPASNDAPFTSRLDNGDRVIRADEGPFTFDIEDMRDAISGKEIEHISELNLDAPWYVVVSDGLAHREVRRPFSFVLYGKRYHSRIP